jgi:lysophospholipase L1-like esterase
MDERRRARLLLAGALAITAGWLALTAEAPQGEEHRFFGRWRAQHFAVACSLLAVCALVGAAAVSRAALLRALFAGLLVTATWGLLEAAGLLGFVAYRDVFGPPRRPPLGREAIPHLDVRGETFEDIAMRWNLPREPVAFHYRTDRHGFRNAHDRAAADVYLVGDSVLVAGLLPFESTIAARLEARIAQPVANVALVAIGPEQERTMFRAAKLPVAGRLVLHFVFEGNDLEDARRYRARLRGGEPPDPLIARSFALNLALWLQRATQPQPPAARERRGTIGGTPYYFAYGPEAGHPEAEDAAALAETCRAFRDAVALGGGRYALVFVPTKLRVLGPLSTFPEDSPLRGAGGGVSRLAEVLRRIADAEDIPFLDLTPALAARARAGGIPWFRADTHPNAIGHDAAAEALAAWDPVRGIAPHRPVG